MSRTLTATFDGEALRLDNPAGLQRNHRYRIVIEDVAPATTGTDVWDVLDAMSGSVEMPPDWSAEHDRYIHAAPREGESETR